ncbi:MAG: AraC family transcriptional regulator [Deltaproteobacteria bacterium]|nr:AraC family transcriptional regulator [Deltaproteobacteria bacterium]
MPAESLPNLKERTPENKYTVSVSLANEVLAMIEELGGDRQAVLAAVGLDAGVLGDMNGRIPLGQVFALYAEAEQRTGEKNIGLRMTARHHPIRNNIILHVFMSSATIGEGIRQAVRYQQLITDGMEHLLELEGNRARFSIRPRDARLRVPRHMAEAGLGSLAMFIRSRLGDGFRPHGVSFQHPAPENLEEHLALFGPSIRFNEERTELVLESAILNHPLAGADAGLKAILEQQAQAMLEKLPVQGGLMDQARNILVEWLPRGGPTIREISRALGCSTRTLQRRLGEEGTTYQALLDEVRCHLARNYLRDSHTPLHEVAYLLGFSEQSTFNRAFRRWTRMTPGEFRAGPSTRP